MGNRRFRLPIYFKKQTGFLGEESTGKSKGGFQIGQKKERNEHNGETAGGGLGVPDTGDTADRDHELLSDHTGFCDGHEDRFKRQYEMVQSAYIQFHAYVFRQIVSPFCGEYILISDH